MIVITEMFRLCVALKKAGGLSCEYVQVGWLAYGSLNLTAEAVEGTALTLERVDDVHGGDGLSLGVLGVRDGISDHVLQEHLEHTAGLLVDETAQALHATSTSETTDRRLRDALDVVAQHLAMALGTTLAQTFTSFAASRHSA